MRDETGLHVGDNGAVVYHWPPGGPFRELWDRVAAPLSDVERCDLHSLLTVWMHETSTLVSYEDENGEWVDVEPDWSIPDDWRAP